MCSFSSKPTDDNAFVKPKYPIGSGAGSSRGVASNLFWGYKILGEVYRPVESHSGARENIIVGPYHPPPSFCMY